MEGLAKGKNKNLKQKFADFPWPKYMDANPKTNENRLVIYWFSVAGLSAYTAKTSWCNSSLTERELNFPLASVIK